MKISTFFRQKSLLISIAMIAAGLLSLFLIPQMFQVMEQRAIEERAQEARAGLEKDAQYALSQARKLDKGRVFDKNIEERDISYLVSQAVEETRNRGLGGILIADKQGAVLTRTRAISQRGDFVFHTTSWGRTLARGEEVAFVDKGAAHPLIVAGATPLIRADTRLGAIVAAYIVNGDYAARFQREYLGSDTHAVFVPKEGVSISSFGDRDINALLDVYVEPQSYFIHTEGATGRVLIGGDSYSVYNIVLEGIEDSPGNLILFRRLNLLALAAAEGVAALILAGGIALLFYFSIWVKRGHFQRVVFTLAIFSVFFAALLGVALSGIERGVPLKKPAYSIYNSTLELAPEGITFSPLFEHPIAIKLKSGGETINVAQTVLRYDPGKIQIVDILITNSFCRPELFVERMFDNEKGEVRIICGLPTPGFSDSEGVVAELLVQPVSPGPFSLRFDEEETKILANDGLGTNVLRQVTNGSYFTARVLGGEENLGDGEGAELLIFSLTHPNQERWYKQKEAEFSWQLIGGDENPSYRYVLDDNPATIPQNGIAVDGDRLRLTAEDGVRWFHLLVEEEGGRQTVAHHKLQIDTVPPARPEIHASADRVGRGEVVRLEFSSKDDQSALQRSFYVRLDGLFFPVGPQLFTAFIKKGAYTVTVRAFDNAGNISEAVKNIMVE